MILAKAIRWARPIARSERAHRVGVCAPALVKCSDLHLFLIVHDGWIRQNPFDARSLGFYIVTCILT